MDVKQEKRIDDYWNIDGSRDLSDPWTGFTQFTLLEEKAPDGYMWSGGRLTRKQLTSRPDHLWPELWKSIGKHAKLMEKQKWSDEKLHLENARKLRGMETSVAPAMPCKILKNCESGASNKIKTKLACILEADESTRMRMGNSIPHHHEDHIAGKGEIHYSTTTWFTNFFPMPQAMKIPATKAVDKEWEKLEFKETIKNARKKLETPVASAMPRKISKNDQNCGNGDKSNKTNSKLACILEASESARPAYGRIFTESS